MESLTQIQILDETVSISLCANALWEKHEFMCSLSPLMDQ